LARIKAPATLELFRASIIEARSKRLIMKVGRSGAKAIGKGFI